MKWKGKVDAHSARCPWLPAVSYTHLDVYKRQDRVFDEPMRREVWMSVQPEAENRVEVRALLDLIEHAFDDRRDWFGR